MSEKFPDFKNQVELADRIVHQTFLDCVVLRAHFDPAALKKPLDRAWQH